MKLSRVVSWLDRTLNVAAFDDVSNNGLQIERRTNEVRTVAFSVDASARAVRAAAEAGAQLLVVHHGISWGGGIRRLAGGVYNVVRAAMDADIAVYACHLPLDAHPTLGNNARLAALLGLKKTKPAFTYHGNVIGLVGTLAVPTTASPADETIANILETVNGRFGHKKSLTVGVCSGGAGEFAEEAKRLGCDLFITGEASWGDVIAAENCSIPMLCAGHYETEVYGVRAVSAALHKALNLPIRDLT